MPALFVNVGNSADYLAIIIEMPLEKRLARIWGHSGICIGFFVAHPNGN